MKIIILIDTEKQEDPTDIILGVFDSMEALLQFVNKNLVHTNDGEEAVTMDDLPGFLEYIEAEFIEEIVQINE